MTHLSLERVLTAPLLVLALLATGGCGGSEGVSPTEPASNGVPADGEDSGDDGGDDGGEDTGDDGAEDGAEDSGDDSGEEADDDD